MMDTVELYKGLQNPFEGMPSFSRFDSRDMSAAVARGLKATVGRADANETALFARQLEYIFTQTYDILYPELKARQLIPVDTRVPSGADSFTYSQFDKRGMGKIVHNYGIDFPNADVMGKQFKQSIVSLGASYQYSIQDMRAAAMAGLPLEARKAEAARFAIELKLEDLAAAGDTATGLKGLTNAPSIQAVTKVSLNNAGATSSTWASLITDALAKGNLTAAAQEIQKDVLALQKTIFTTTKGVHIPDTLVLPTDAFAVLATTPRAPGFTDDSLLDYILEVSPWLKSIEFWPRLDGAAPSAVNSVWGRVMCYQKDPKVLALIISQEFEQFAPQPRNMSFIVPVHMRTGAVEVRYPLAVAYMDGVGGSSTQDTGLTAGL